MKSIQEIANSLNASLSQLLADSDECSPKEVTIGYLLWMLDQINQNPQWEIDKANRWIGYVQGVMVARRLTTVDLERDRVRCASDTAETPQQSPEETIESQRILIETLSAQVDRLSEENRKLRDRLGLWGEEV